MPRTKQAQQVECGLVIDAWEVVGDTPVRTNGVLQWRCRCEAGHEKQIAHHDLQFGVVPTQCAQCVEQAATARANERLEEKRLEAEFRNMQRLAHQAQIAQQQQEGI
jgi:hypothetical protein